MHWVLRTRFVVARSFLTSEEGTREEDCLTYLVHPCRTALQRRVKFVRTLRSHTKKLWPKEILNMDQKKNKRPTDTHSNGEKKNRHRFSNIPSDFGISHSKVI